MRTGIHSTRRRLLVVLALGLLAVAILAGAAGVSEAARSTPLATGPVNTVKPTVAGTLVVGYTLTASSGTWSGTGAITYSYQWERCDSNGQSCTALNSVSSQTWTIVSNDVGHTLVVLVTATDSNGSSTASSGPTAVITSSLAKPSNSASPTISVGAAYRGQTLTASPGSWSGTAPITFSYQWQRCDTHGSSCSAVNPVSSSTWTLGSSDVNHTMRVVVTAKNSAGSASATSDATGVVTYNLDKPVNSSTPTISGTVAIGQNLTASKGSWGGTSPVTYTYQWQRCDSHGNGCAAINAVSSTTYKIVTNDATHTIRVAVSAHNAAGTVTATSSPTALVPAPAPVAPPPPPTAINLGNGVVSVTATSVVLPDRLVISGISYSPRILHHRQTFTATFRVTDTAGHVVRGALVKLIGLPYARLAPVSEQPTGTDGRVTFVLVPTRKFPFRRGAALAMFVRARAPGQNVLAGSSTRRLTQIRVGRITG